MEVKEEQALNRPDGSFEQISKPMKSDTDEMAANHLNQTVEIVVDNFGYLPKGTREVESGKKIDWISMERFLGGWRQRIALYEIHNEEEIEDCKLIDFLK